MNIFVSYSHSDSRLVDPIVKLLELNASAVFYDARSIRPGKKWRAELCRGISDCQLLVLFWCRHSITSPEVQREWNDALAQDKDLLPLLLDDTPLPNALREFQWIDFRDVTGDHGEVRRPDELEGVAGKEPSELPEAPARGGYAAAAGIIVAAIALLGVAATGLLLGGDEHFGIFWLASIAVIVVIAASILVVARINRRAPPIYRPAPSPGPAATDDDSEDEPTLGSGRTGEAEVPTELKMALEIERELVRRSVLPRGALNPFSA